MRMLYLVLSELEQINDNPQWAVGNRKLLKAHWHSPVKVPLVTDVVDVIFLKRDPITKLDLSGIETLKDVVILISSPVQFEPEEGQPVVKNIHPCWIVPVGENVIFLFSYLNDNTTLVFSVIDTEVVRQVFSVNPVRKADLQERRANGTDLVISIECEVYPGCLTVDEKATLWSNLQFIRKVPGKLKAKADADLEKLFGNML